MNTSNYNLIRSYVDKNAIATLSTINEDGVIHGAAIYVCADEDRPVVYFLTKQDTRKFRNLRAHPQVSLTIVNRSENSTLQADGEAFEVSEAHVIDSVMEKISREHDYAHDWLPPIAKIRAGAYVVVGITLSSARLAQFKDKAIGDKQTFTELGK